MSLEGGWIAESEGMVSPAVVGSATGALLQVLRGMLPGSTRLSSAVGFFFVSGLRGLVEDLSELDEIRLLIGNTSTRETIEQIAEGMNRLEPALEEVERLRYSKRTDRMLRAERTAEHVRETIALLDQDDEDQRVVRALIHLIETRRLRVRVYTRGRLHGRAHIVDFREPRSGVPGVAVVGSSNLTLNGMADPTELNVVVRDAAGGENHAALTAWFDRLWDEAQDFDVLLMRELQASWAARPVTPWDIYLKTLYTLVHARGGSSDDDTLFDDEITRSLADFQRVAVQQAVSRIRRHGGCFVADVVGLGKSFVGAAIIKHFERSEGRRSLIVCPKPLEEMWLRYNERYDLNAAVVPMSMLMTSDRGVDLFEQYPGRDFVLIDESHSFRNPGSQRYEALANYVQADDRRLCLLTATPRNSRAWDIYHQLKLFHPEDTTDLPIDPPDLRAFFSRVEQGSASIKDVLRHVMIRRTRRHILRWWGIAADTRSPLVELDDDAVRPYLTGERRCFIHVGGRENYFPRRNLETVRYSIEQTYEGLYSDIRSRLGGPVLPGGGSGPRALTYARYGLWHYLRPELRGDDRYIPLRRTGNSLRGLIRVMLFKRLESSVAAFRLTLVRMIERHRLFMAAVDDGLIPAGEDAEALLGRAGIDDHAEVLDQLAGLIRKYDIGDFDSEKLLADLQNDIDVLQSMIELVDPITPDHDDKAQTLLARIESEGWAGRKVLIFTQFADTAEYLAKVIDPGGESPDIEAMYGQSKSKARVVGRFAPRANPLFAPRSGESEIRILVATDVLSEGLNMQDCEIVVNYDLHWNPVRLIQRLGRIDRIGSEHDEIHAFNFLPETGIEQNLGILGVLRDRIAEIHETIGEDAQILDESERLNEEAMFAIYQGDASVLEGEGPEAEEMLDLTEAEEVLRQLEREDPTEYARIAALRDGIRSARRGEVRGVYALCQAGEYLEPVLVDESGETVSRDLGRVLHVIRADRTDPAPASMPAGYNAHVQEIRARFAARVRERQVSRGYVSRMSAGQRYVIDQLDEEMARESDEGRVALLHLLRSAFESTPTPAIRKELQRLKRNERRGPAMVQDLQELYSRHHLRDRSGRSQQRDHAEIPRIICSEALL